MQEIKILIADDEGEARALIVYYLQQSPLAFNIAEAINGQDALEKLEVFNPDILFLDIKMPGLSGTELLQLKTGENMPAVIFTTAFEEYALPAFGFDAVDYLLKPFDGARFLKALQKAIDYVQFIKPQKVKTAPAHILVKNGAKAQAIALSGIVYLEAYGQYVKLISNDRTELISQPLYRLEKTLPEDVFVRIHRSFIVNINFVKQIKSLLNGDYMVLLKNGAEIRASRTYRHKLQAAFGQF